MTDKEYLKKYQEKYGILKEKDKEDILKYFHKDLNEEKFDLNSHIWKPETLKYGSTGIDVYVLQGILVAKKFYADNNRREIDGEYGAKTQAAVNQAKKFYGMIANGVCDKPLLKRLLEVG